MQTTRKRSAFVTVLSWMSIVASGLSMLATIGCGMFMTLLFKRPAFKARLDILPPEAFPIDHFPVVVCALIFFLCFMCSLLVFISAIGLLKRKNWARATFIFLLVLGLIWNIVAILSQILLIKVVILVKAELAATFPAGMDVTAITMLTVSASASLIAMILCGWMLKRLISRKTAAEFRPVATSLTYIPKNQRA